MYRQQACLSSPSSSVNVTPSSSPVFGPADSSPPTSPGLVPYSLDSPPRPFTHPFAASTKAVKRPPNYEKKTDSPPCTPPGTFTLRSIGLCRGIASRSLQEDDFLSSAFPDGSPPPHRTSKYIDREVRIWDDALRKPFDTGIGQIDLSNQQLKSIPPSIGDLSGFFNTPEVSEQSLFSTRVWARINTEPSRTRSFGRTQSITDSGKERHVLKLYLMGNMITSLPPELFTVKNLTVLSLRGNKLTFIPPEIVLLTHLHELNISNNQLKFLPWQMRDMKIEKLMVNPNPFLPEPDAIPDLDLDPDTPPSPLPRPPLRTRRSITRLWARRTEPTSTPVLSPVTHTLAPVPPLTELCLRLLLAPSPTSPEPTTVLAEYYGHPLSDAWSDRVPPSVHRILGETLPGILRARKRATVGTPDRTGYHTATGTCPHPAHAGSVFVKHASARFSWERRVAGVDVGGAVPLYWRGCLTGCLDFLEDARSPCVPVCGPRTPAAHGLGDDDDVDVDVDVDVPDVAVHVVDLGHVELDMEGFDD